MPINYKNYPKNWKTEIRPAILKRSGNCCEFCGIENNLIGYRDELGFHSIEQSFYGDMIAEDAKEQGFKIIKIVLIIAHLDHNPSNNDYSNLKALCQKCHLNYNIEHNKKNSMQTIEKKKKLQSLF